MLVGVEIGKPLWSTNDSLDELEQLAATAGVEVVGRVTQKLSDPNPATLVGKGKLEEIKAAREETAAAVTRGRRRGAAGQPCPRALLAAGAAPVLASDQCFAHRVTASPCSGSQNGFMSFGRTRDPGTRRPGSPASGTDSNASKQTCCTSLVVWPKRDRFACLTDFIANRLPSPGARNFAGRGRTVLDTENHRGRFPGIG